MIHSMTGYGDAECHHDGLSFALELRSVNNRYFKALIKLPEFLQSLESDIEKLLRARLTRGSITYHLKVKSRDSLGAAEINTAVLRGYLDQLQALVQDGTIERPNVGALLDLPGVCVQRECDEHTREELWAAIKTQTLQAIDKLMAMRRDEGQALANDLLNHARQIRELADATAGRAPQVVDDYRNRLQTRVNQLLNQSGLSVNDSDLLREVAIFAERCDISEELIRLRSHLDQFEELCRGGDAGRKLDFLTQEMLREANTVGSKANDTAIARNVVEIKGLIDRLKEQVQNVV